MKKIIALILIFISLSVFADVFVNGYYKKDGTYVQPHYRSNPDGNILNNWSTQGNINPYTGKPGTVNPFPSIDQPIKNLYQNNNLYDKYPGLRR